MQIGAILPHLGPFGGVRRFLEIGNVFVKRGISYTIFARRDSKCNWFDYKGEIRDWSKINADYILIGDPPSFRILSRTHGRIYVYVIAGGRYIPMYQSVYGKYPFILNNRVFKRSFPHAHLVEGGVNVHHFKPKKLIPASSNVRVLYYGVKREGKGSSYIAHALHSIPGVIPVALGGLNDEKLLQAYHTGDFFVLWESRAGWGNMAAEALASGLTVVTNGINCEPFRDKVIVVKDLRKFFLDSQNRKIRKLGSMEQFSWERVVDQFMKIFQLPYRPGDHSHKHIHKHVHKHAHKHQHQH